MGCCASRPRDNNPSAVATLPPTPSARNITAPSTRHGSTPSPAPAADTNGRPNAALRPIPPDQRSKLPATLASPAAKSSQHRVRPLTDSTNLTWTRARLEQERTDWWDTQVTGSAEIWGAIRIAAQHLQKGEVAEAQTMLDATGCTCPNGMLWKGVYGPTGVLYKAPEWLFVEPEGLAEEGEEEGKDDEDDERGSGVREAGGAASQVPGAAEVEADEGAELEAEKDETAAVRIRTSHDQKDVTVHIRQRETVGAIVQKLKQQIELSPSTRVKLVYGGRPYHDNDTLSANTFWNFANAHTLVALVLE